MNDKRINKVSVLLPSEEFDRFTSYCEKYGFKKTSLIQRLIKTHLDTEGFDTQSTFAFENNQRYGKPNSET